MPQFFYKARDRGGKLITGEMEGPNRGDIAGRIGGMGYIPVLIQATAVKNPLIPTGAKEAPGLGKEISFAFLDKFRKVKPKELLFFTSQLATIIRAGIPITTGLSILAEQSKNPILSNAVLDVLERVKEGRPPIRRPGPSSQDIYRNLYPDGAGRRGLRKAGRGP